MINYLKKNSHRFTDYFLLVAELVEALPQITQNTKLPVVVSPDQQLFPQIQRKSINHSNPDSDNDLSV